MFEPHSDVDSMLETCLQNLYKGLWTVEDCLAHYPAHADALEPLLRSAADLRAARRLVVRPAFRSGAAPRMSARLQHSRRRPAMGRVSAARPVFPRRLAGYAIALLVLVILAAGSAGTIYAADGSLPGEPLYGVKLSVEQAQIDVSPPGKAIALQMKFAEKRLKEAEKLAARGDNSNLQTALDSYDQLVAQATQALATSGADDQSLQAMDAALSTHQAQLQALLVSVPEPAKKGISQAIEASKHGQEQAAQARSKHTGKPDATPEVQPGQPQGTSGDTPGNGKSDDKGKPPDTPGNGSPSNSPEGSDNSQSNGKGQSKGKGQPPAKGNGNSGGTQAELTCANGMILSAEVQAQARSLADQYNVIEEDVLALFCSGLNADQVATRLASSSP
jgi:Domain of unknown function (DUF5667)